MNVKEAIEAKMKQREEARKSAFDRWSAIHQRICPDCAGDLERMPRLVDVFTSSRELKCLSCGAVHKFNVDG